jgi:uncharacterized repeat protein (TIGR03803 family)
MQIEADDPTNSASICTDANENIIIVGSFNGTLDFDPGVGTAILTSTTEDIFIQKLDADGNLLWVKQVGGIDLDRANSVTTDASGNVFITGFFNGVVDFDPAAGTANLTAIDNDIFVQKLDANGNFIWVKHMGGNGSDYGNSIATDASGNVVSTGVFEGTVDFDPGAGIINITSSGKDTYVQKLDNNGNLIWVKQIEGIDSGEVYGHSLALDAIGNVYTAGLFRNSVDFDPGAASSVLFSVGISGDFFIQKLDANGNYLWATQFGGGALLDYDIAISADASGNVYSTSSFNGTGDFDPGLGTIYLTSIGYDDIYIQKLDENGNLLWLKQLGGTDSDISNFIKTDDSGNVITTGAFKGTVDFDPGAEIYNLTSSETDNYNTFIHRLDTDGNFIWAKQMGGSIAIGNAVMVDANNNIYTTGKFTGIVDFDPGADVHNLTGIGTASIFIQKLSPCVPSAGIDVVSACDSYTWILNGENYYSSGSYSTILSNAAGCDSVVTLDLTINQSTTTTTSKELCDFYIWDVNGQTYTEIGTYYDSLTSSTGCDSIHILELSIHYKDRIWGMTSGGLNSLGGTIFSTRTSGKGMRTEWDFSTINGITSKYPPVEYSNGLVYGVTRNGGTYNEGIIYSFDPASEEKNVVFSFEGLNGRYPSSPLLFSSDGFLYGLTDEGGANDDGTLYAYNPEDNSLVILHSFDSISDGKSPIGRLAETVNGLLYGTTYTGGSNEFGILFSYTKATNAIEVLFNFDDIQGKLPKSGVTLADDGILYGVTNSGGSNNLGVIFSYDPATITFSKRFEFTEITMGVNPSGELFQAADGLLYGITLSPLGGVIFDFNPVTDVYTKRKQLSSTIDGFSCYGGFVEANNGKLYAMSAEYSSFSGSLFEFDPGSNEYEIKVVFDGLNGHFPESSLFQASSGLLYGVTTLGGSENAGVLFSYYPISDSYSKIIDFNSYLNGKSPHGSLTTASQGKFYGMTYEGGENNLGVIFEFDSHFRNYKLLHSFNGVDGAHPDGSLNIISGKLFGTTNHGGINDSGVLFEFDVDLNLYTIKHLFTNVNSEGYEPVGALLFSNGLLYGMTQFGGTYAAGVIYTYDIESSNYTVVHHFQDTLGIYPNGELIKAGNGMLYGLTQQGGENDLGTLFSFDPATNEYSVLLSFSEENGGHPKGSLLKATNGNLYGLTAQIPDGINGSLFEYDLVSENGYSVLFTFNTNSLGVDPQGSLEETFNGKLFGLTNKGGDGDFGVFFEYDIVANTYVKKTDFLGYNGKSPIHTRPTFIDKPGICTNFKTVCDSFTWNINGQTYTQSGTYYALLVSSEGCDSIVDICLTINKSTNYIFSETACNSFFWEATGQTYNTSGSYADTLVGALGCDSILTLNLTINISTNSNVSITACESYFWDANDQTYTESGSYQAALVSTSGCDSIVNLDLTINASTNNTVYASACDSYFWDANGQTYNTSGTYSLLLSNALGCDSIISIELTIINSTSTSTSVSACVSYFWEVNGQIYSESGVYQEFLVSSSGCDSIINLDLTVSEVITNNVTLTACEPYYWDANNETYNESGIYQATLISSMGCDSTVNLDLTVNFGSNTAFSETSCGPYTAPDGNIYYQNGIYTAIISNYIGCDSTITIDLVVVQIDNSVYLQDDIITAAEGDYTYQWIDCFNGNYIEGENSISFIPNYDGIYQVSISQGECILQSGCVEISNLNEWNIIIYPNPVQDMITIESKKAISIIAELSDYTYRELMSVQFPEAKVNYLDLSPYAQGCYFLTIKAGSKLRTYKIIKN